MGAVPFMNVSTGTTPEEAFGSAVQQARYEDGHGGYSGTIAEKHSIVVIKHPSHLGGTTLPTSAEVKAFANKLIEDNDERIDSKWGPAGCIEFQPARDTKGMRCFLFFGWASS
jgi:hypothetical protein